MSEKQETLTCAGCGEKFPATHCCVTDIRTGKHYHPQCQPQKDKAWDIQQLVETGVVREFTDYWGDRGPLLQYCVIGYDAEPWLATDGPCIDDDALIEHSIEAKMPSGTAVMKYEGKWRIIEISETIPHDEYETHGVCLRSPSGSRRDTLQEWLKSIIGAERDELGADKKLS